MNKSWKFWKKTPKVVVVPEPVVSKTSVTAPVMSKIPVAAPVAAPVTTIDKMLERITGKTASEGHEKNSFYKNPEQLKANNHNNSQFRSRLPATTPELMANLLSIKTTLYKDNPEQYQRYLLQTPSNLLSPWMQKEKIRMEKIVIDSKGNIGEDRFR